MRGSERAAAAALVAAALGLGLGAEAVQAQSGGASRGRLDVFTRLDPASIRGGTLTWSLDFHGDTAWQQGAQGMHGRVDRSVRATVRLRGERRADQPLADLAAPAALAPEKARRLRALLLGADLRYREASELCGTDPLCQREMDRLIGQRVGGAGGGPAKSPARGEAGARYLVLTPAGAGACDSVRATVADAMLDQLRADVPGQIDTRNVSDAWELAGTPALAAVCGATLVVDLRDGLTWLDLPHGAHVRLHAEVVAHERREEGDVELSETAPGVHLRTGPGRLPGFGRVLEGNAALPRVFATEMVGRYHRMVVPVRADLRWRFEPDAR